MASVSSATNFLPDNKLRLRAIGDVALVAQFTSPAIDLVLLKPYWNTDEWGVARDLLFGVSLESIALAGGQSYAFSLEIDSDTSFGSPTTVDAETITSANSASGLFDLALTRETLLKLDHTAGFIRLKMVPTGVAEIGQIVVGSTAHDGDTVTIDDGFHTPTVFTFGDGTGGTVDKGSTATNSAQNLKAAIAAAAATLGVTAAGAAATLNLTNTAKNVGGSIATASGGRITVTTWHAGADASVKFWSFVRAGPYSRG